MEAVVFLDRRVFVNFVDAPKVPIELCIGSSSVQLTPAKQAEVDELMVAQGSHLAAREVSKLACSNPPERKRGDFFDLRVNELKEWALLGHDTIQIKFNRRDERFKVSFGKRIVFTSSGENHIFRTNLATHRASATLIVEFRELNSGRLQRHKIPFRSDCKGGMTTVGYQNVEIIGPKWIGLVEIDLSVEYEGYNDDGSSQDAFAFIAGTRVEEVNSRDIKLLKPRLLFTDILPKNGVWFSSFVPDLPVPGSVITLQWGSKSERFNLEPPLELDFSFSENVFFKINSASSCMLSIYVDGYVKDKLRVESGENSIQFPIDFCDGNTHLISIRDEAGFTTYLEEFVNLPFILTPVDVLQREAAHPLPATVLFSDTIALCCLKKDACRIGRFS